MLAVSVVGFATAWWLGCYLLSRDPRKPLLRRTAAGLLAYAVALATVDVPVVGTIAVGVPALAWTGVLVRLPQGRAPGRAERWWWRGWLPVGGLALLLAAVTDLWWLRGMVFGALGAGLAAALAVAWRRRLIGSEGDSPEDPNPTAASRRPARLGASSRHSVGVIGPILVMTLLFGLGMSGLLFDLAVVPRSILLVLIGIDLIALGGLIAWSDAVDESQLLAVDMVRSAVTAAIITALFAGQVAVVMALVPSAELVKLMYGCVAAAITVQVLAGPLNRLLDRWILPTEMEQQRTELRDAMAALPRRGPLDEVDDAEFASLVRRALSNYADLGRLVASPLVALPVIDERLAARGASDTPLERAAELKALLRESIEQLRPHGELGLTDEWRHYNSLYFIYVVGLRPYSRRAHHGGQSDEANRVLEWLRTRVPQRSLHNWQRVAARLVADSIRSRPARPDADLRHGGVATRRGSVPGG